MENNETCIHGGVSPISLLADLHHSQAGSGRHRCPTCAFEQGFNIGSSGNWNTYEDYCNSLTDPETCQIGSIAPTHILSNLGDNQGGTGRHKCTNCAFKQGFEVGILENCINEISIEVVPAPNLSRIQENGAITSSTIDFIEKEIRNKHLGLLGELFILKGEIDFLKSNGKDELANKVQHVSVEIGDGLGYDILSYDLLGNEKKIEVKTTRSDISRPFYLTRNELVVSANNSETYYLYRLFDFDSREKKGKYYIIEGNLTDELILDALVFVAYPKPNHNI
ncbi:MAG: DUF3883 domain-containing protein [Bacteroidales bacterium]|nr:DUF3883 domain-containing protein [Bacteroidales bacterium]